MALTGPLFDVCPTSLWVDDFSALMARLDQIRAAGVRDIHAHFTAHPEFLYECVGLIRAVRANPASIAMFGAATEEELLARMPEVFTAETLPVFQAQIETLFAGKTRFEGEVEGQTLDGRRLDLLLELAVPGEPPDYAQVLFAIVDITELKTERAARLDAETEARLQQLQKLESLGILAGGIAHDFNNLLVGVLGNIELAEMSLSPVAPAREHLGRALRASERAAELCRQMLAYSGKGRFLVEPLDISRLVQEMAELIAVSVPKTVVLTVDLEDDVPAVEADASQLRQVVMNLITNAAESIGEQRGVVSVRTGALQADRAYLDALDAPAELPEGSYVQLEVSDTGQGMDAQTRTRIFEPFFTTKFTGRGLGLAAVLGIVRGHRGALKVYSEPGQGTTIKVLLPALDAPAAIREAPASKTVPAVSGLVLVVDDEDAVRTVAVQALSSVGIDVIEAVDGAEALERFRERPEIDLVLLDLTMPRLGGEAVFRELRRIDPEVRVIVTSGYNEQEVVNRFAGKGLAGFLQKPWSPRRLVEAVTRELVARRGGSED